MARPLVIVESPAKAKTLSRFLGRRYRVEASYGHVRDLPESADEVPDEIRKKPWGRFGVDTEGDFTPYYVIPAGKRRHVQALRTALKDASEVLLATDPDREGESISWHLTEVLKPKVPVRRVVFHEITEGAVREALESPQQVNENLVRAQESRRILDRLYGYSLSPVLWKRVQTGLSAGRVQSVAVRLLVEREEERVRFRGSTYWDLEARLAGDDREFVATLVRIGDERLATGKDFDPATGALKSERVRLLTGPDANGLVETLRANTPWIVSSVEEKPVTQRPAPPFTTSTLQQEANRKLGYSAERTMDIAQRLFQGMEIGGGEIEGLITYHRTDSTTLSEKALGEAARVIREMFGAEYHEGPRQYQTKVRNAQEAHEAIRPTDFRQSPQKLESVLRPDELRLYELVWKRTIASQMGDAKLLRTTIEITAQGPGGQPHTFAASGKTIEFAGFLRAYVEGSDDPASELGDQQTLLPPCKTGDRIDHPDGGTPISLVGLDSKVHETLPPARYTEASLVKRLEEDGIGRPSTYAPIIATIQRRGYVFRQGKALVPSFTAFAVTTLLRDHFGDWVDINFTAKMEELLDQISNGELDWFDFLREFFRDGDGERRGLEPTVANLGQIDYPTVEVGIDPASGQPIRVRVGRYGPFLQLGKGGPGNTASLPPDLPPADVTVDKAMALIRAKAEGPRLLGVDPATGLNVYAVHGRFGAYVQLGETPPRGSKADKPKRASLQPPSTEATATLDEALRLLEMPRTLGEHPSDGAPVLASLGRYGPYVKHGDEYRSLEAEDDVFTVSLDRALALLAAPKKARRRQSAAKTVLADLGAHPDSGAPVRVLAGRYGPYVTDGTTNASLPRGMEPPTVTLEIAVGLLAARAGAAPSSRRGVRTSRKRAPSQSPKSDQDDPDDQEGARIRSLIRTRE